MKFGSRDPNMAKNELNLNENNSHLIDNCVQVPPTIVAGIGTVLVPLVEEWTSSKFSFPPDSLPILRDKLSCLFSGSVRLNKTP